MNSCKQCGFTGQLHTYKEQKPEGGFILKKYRTCTECFHKGNRMKKSAIRAQGDPFNYELCPHCGVYTHKTYKFSHLCEGWKKGPGETKFEEPWIALI